jgi:hypothetical protein
MTKPNNPYRKRKEVFADRSIQASLGRRILTHWLLFTGLLLVLNTLVQVSFVFPQVTLGEAFWSSAKAQIPLVLCILAIAPLFTRDALRISNSLAGPMVRLRRSLQGLANGEKIPPLVFRENDYWLESATEFNRVRQLVLGLYKDLDIPAGPQGSEQLAQAANLLQDPTVARSTSNPPKSSSTQERRSPKPVEASVSENVPSSLSLANRVIWQGERNNKPTRYVNHDTEPMAVPVDNAATEEIPVNVSSR